MYVRLRFERLKKFRVFVYIVRYYFNEEIQEHTQLNKENSKSQRSKKRFIIGILINILAQSESAYGSDKYV